MAKKRTQTQRERERGGKVSRARQEKESKWGRIYQQERDIYNGGKTKI